MEQTVDQTSVDSQSFNQFKNSLQRVQNTQISSGSARIFWGGGFPPFELK